MTLSFLGYSDLKFAVIELQDIARLQNIEKLFMRDRDRILVRGVIGQRQSIFGAIFQFYRSTCKGAGSDFRALQVGEDRQRNRKFLFNNPVKLLSASQEWFDKLTMSGKHFPSAHPELVEGLFFVDAFLTQGTNDNGP